MQKKTLIFILFCVILLVSNTFSIIVTAIIYSSRISNTPQYINPSPTARVTINPTQENISNGTVTVTPTPTLNNFNVVKSTASSKTYDFDGYQMEIPNTYKVSMNEDGYTIDITPIENRFATHQNSISLIPLNNFSIYPGFDATLDSSLLINNVKHAKIATIFGEGTGGMLSGEIDYFIFTYPYVIRETINTSTKYTDNPSVNFHSLLPSSILNKDGQALVNEMDQILSTYHEVD